jgi:glycosyltransferase involved in cell wall biosynthesis
MKVTVAVLTYNEEANIPDILGSIEAQSFPRNQFEILVVDNASTDGTITAVEKLAGHFNNIRLVINPIKGIAKSRNVAVREAKGELLAFTDADVVVPPNWLSTLVDGFEGIKANGEALAAVGGGNVPFRAKDNRFLAAVGITLNSFWGSHGSAQGMLHDVVTQVDHIPTLNILYDRKLLLEHEGFDENFRMVCEDPELNHRLGKEGYAIYFLPGATVQHKMRPGLWPWLKNVFTYGRGRTQLIRKHPDHFKLMYAIPPLIVLALLATPFGFLSQWLFLPLLYFLPPAIIATQLTQKAGRLDCLRHAFAILALNPIAYGFGMLYAMFKKTT